MKTLKFIAVLVATTAILLLPSCNERNTPDYDTTELWPAYSASFDKYGFINKKGEWAIQPNFDGVSTFSCGYARVSVSNRNYFINKKGDIQQSITFDMADDFQYNYCVVSINNQCGMIDNRLSLIVPAIYPALGAMSSSGLALASMDGKSYGFLDKKGNWGIVPQYEAAGDFVDGVAVFSVGNKYGAINTKGGYAVMPIYDQLLSVGESRLRFRDSNSGNYGLLGVDGKQKVQAMYKAIGTFFDNGLAVATFDGENYGYIDANGNQKIMFQYKRAFVFADGYAWVYQGNAWIVINTKGEVQYNLPSEWVPASNFHNGLALIADESGDEYHYIQPNGKIVFTWYSGSNWVSQPTTTLSSGFDSKPSENYCLGTTSLQTTRR